MNVDKNIFYNLKNGSWLAIIPNGFKINKEEYNELWKKQPKVRQQYKIYGKKVDVPRYLQLYGNVKVYVSGETFIGKPITLDILKRALEYAKKIGNSDKYNACLVNYYTCGRDYIGFHSDKESQINQNVPIVSISLGGTRRFVLLEKSTKKRILDILLKNTMVVIMGGKNFQKDFKHSVPKVAICEPRINITLRSYNQ